MALRADVPEVGAAFKELLNALCHQYEMDLADARRKAEQRGAADEIYENDEKDEHRLPRTAGAAVKRNRTAGANFARIVPDEDDEVKDSAMNAPRNDEGLLTRFAKSSHFERLSAGLLISNAIFLGIQVDKSFSQEPPAALYIVDYIFNVFFVIELCIRMAGLGCRVFWCDEDLRAWNAFDFVIVVLSAVDTAASLAASDGNTPLGNISILRIIRVIRILRVLRIIRVLKFFRDLRILIASITVTMKSAVFALILILCGLYMFGVALTQMVADHVKEQTANGTPILADDDMLFFFGSVGHTMFALFMTIAGGIDWKDAALPLLKVGSMAIALYIVFVIVMIMCVMNVLTGLFCQAAIETAGNDRENMMHVQLQEKKEYIEVLTNLFHEWDDNGDGKFNIDEFTRHIEDEDTIALLRTLEIDARDALTLFELLDTNSSGEIDLEEFITGCITLRGGAKAVHMEKSIAINSRLVHSLEAIEGKLKYLVHVNDEENGKELKSGKRTRTSVHRELA